MYVFDTTHVRFWALAIKVYLSISYKIYSVLAIFE